MAELRVILVLGGARSGKSSFAENLASNALLKDNSPADVTYIATAKRSDPEMKARIDKHVLDRPNSWHTVEEPLDLSNAIPNALKVSDVVVVDCLTCWLGNYIARAGKIPGSEDSIDDESVAWSKHFDEISRKEIAAGLEEGEKVAQQIKSKFKKTVIFVSNETGLGIVPMYRVSRYYRDTLGRVNQDIGRVSTNVYFMVAGCAVDIKKLHADAKLT
ncbi:hypothetical protein HK098_003139 [Nowakowskiella sp. JEL0407]|nr:hypothetical protein HK098_003139 [Nowakowskiella sp. JEL0407]